MGGTRLALLHLVLGAWLAVSAATVVGAGLSFAAAPSAVEAASSAPDGAGLRGARAQAMRFNGAMFAAAGRAQLVLAGLAVFLAAWPRVGSRMALACIAGAALVAALLALAVTPRATALATPRIEALERGDTSPRDAADDARFRGLHRAHAGLDLAKSLLLVGASVAALRAGASSAPPTRATRRSREAGA